MAKFKNSPTTRQAGTSPNLGFGKQNGELTNDADFYTVHSVVSLVEHQYGEIANGQLNAKFLSEIIQQKGNMKYMVISSSVQDLSVAATATFFGLGTDYNQAATTVFTYKFMIDQHAFLTGTIFNALLDNVAVPFVTVNVPITGPSTRNETVFETSDAAAKNTNVIVSDNL